MHHLTGKSILNKNTTTTTINAIATTTATTATNTAVTTTATTAATAVTTTTAASTTTPHTITFYSFFPLSLFPAYRISLHIFLYLFLCIASSLSLFTAEKKV